jgi:hypothetical protein
MGADAKLAHPLCDVAPLYAAGAPGAAIPASIAFDRALLTSRYGVWPGAAGAE